MASGLSLLGFVLDRTFMLLASFHLYKSLWATRQRGNGDTTTGCQVSSASKNSGLPKLTYRFVSFSAIWYSAYTFGLAHYHSLTKVVITTFGPLISLCRLVHQRKTLWGAISSHATHNALVNLWVSFTFEWQHSFEGVGFSRREPFWYAVSRFGWIPSMLSLLVLLERFVQCLESRLPTTTSDDSILDKGKIKTIKPK